MTGPLHGVRVLSLEGLGPVPFTNMMLSDMGADVVRVVRPAHRSARHLAETRELEPAHNIPDRGTRSVAIDLKSDEGRSTIRQLMSETEVFIEGFRPGVVERLGIGPDVALAANPVLVYARLTGFGQDSAFAQRAGHDINYIAESGALHMLGRPGEHPRPPANLLGDYAGGGCVAAFGIVSALLHAQSTGCGQVVDVSMTDGTALLMAKLFGLRASGVLDGDPGTHFIDGAAPFYATYECADGGFIAVGALEESFYAEFLAGLGVDTSRWPDQNDRNSWPELRRLIAGVIAEKSRAHWTAVYDTIDACVSPVLSPEEAQERHAHRGFYTTVDGIPQPAPSPRFSRTPTKTNPSMANAASLSAEDVLAQWRN